MEHVGLGLITFGVVAEDVEIGAPGWFAFVLALCPVPEEGFADVEPDRRELLVFPVLNVGSGLHFDSEVAVLFVTESEAALSASTTVIEPSDIKKSPAVIV